MRRSVEHSAKKGSARIVDRSMLLTKSELVRVAVDARAGDAAAYERLVNGMSRMVFAESYSVYRSWRTHLPASASFDDVFSAGLLGLHKATLKFDETTGNAFTTYAKSWIRNACQRQVYTMVGIVHLPEKRLVKGVAPDDPMLCGLSLERVGDNGRAMYEDVPSPHLEQVVDLGMIRRVFDVLRCVDERLPEIVELLQSDHGYREVSRITGVTVEQVKRLVARGADAVQESGLAEDYLEG